MRTIRTIIGSILVYLCVATIQACGTKASMMGMGGSQGHGGSGSVVAPANADESGSRIEVVYQIGDDGSKIVPSYYDKSRGEYCNTYQASDGRVRCMPAPGLGGNGSSALALVYFSDPGCSTIVAARYSCYAAPKYVLEAIGTTTCAPYYKVYAAGAALSATATVYIGNPGACAATPMATGTSYYTAGAEIQPSAFVGFTPQMP